VDEQDVHVRGVVQLAATELAHPDHGEGLGAGLAGGHVQADLGDRGHLPNHVVDGFAGQVARGHTGGGAAAEPSQAGLRAQAGDVGLGLDLELCPVPGLQVGEQGDLLGVGDQEVGDGRGQAQDGDRSVEHHRVRQQLPGTGVLADARQGHPRALGIRRRGQGSSQLLGRGHGAMVSTGSRSPSRRGDTVRA
jgi:hypothetical protein